MENQEQRNGTNVALDIKDSIITVHKATGNPLKYTWNFFGMALTGIGSIVLLKGNQIVKGYNQKHYSEDEIEKQNRKADVEMNHKLASLTGFISSISFGKSNSSNHGSKTLK